MKLFDAHFHIINPKFPLVENNGYLPPEFTAEDYINTTSNYDIAGGAIVSGSFQTFDQKYLIDALKTLGTNFFGVANIPANISKEELEQLDNANVVAVRFNVKRGGSEKIEHIEKLMFGTDLPMVRCPVYSKGFCPALVSRNLRILT